MRLALQSQELGRLNPFPSAAMIKRTTEAAMEWLQRGHAQRDHQMVFLKVDPRLDALRGRTDFGRLLERMRF